MPPPADRSPVPALDRGLRIIDLALDSGRELSFSEITATMGVAKASAARLLRVLCERGYLSKSPATGRYHPGHRLLGGRSSTERLKRVAAPAIHRLADLTGNTVLLIAWDGRSAVCLDRATSEDAIAMQKPGHIAKNPFEGPWAWFFLASLPADEQRRRRREVGLEDGRLRLMRRELRTWNERGWVGQLDHKRTRRRVGAPLFDAHGNVVGGLGMGGNAWTMPDDHLEDCGRAVAEEARGCSHALGWDGGLPGLLLAE